MLSQEVSRSRMQQLVGVIGVNMGFAPHIPSLSSIKVYISLPRSSPAVADGQSGGSSDHEEERVSIRMGHPDFPKVGLGKGRESRHFLMGERQDRSTQEGEKQEGEARGREAREGREREARERRKVWKK
jgi:hypothetical protein